MLMSSRSKGGWSTGRLAIHIGMTANFIRTEIESGELRASRFGREWRIELTEVRRYCRANRWPEPPEAEPTQSSPSVRN